MAPPNSTEATGARHEIWLSERPAYLGNRLAQYLLSIHLAASKFDAVTANRECSSRGEQPCSNYE
jgi:hypothetical protein